MMLKRVINQAIDAMGLPQTQMFATVFDGARATVKAQPR